MRIHRTGAKILRKDLNYKVLYYYQPNRSYLALKLINHLCLPCFLLEMLCLLTTVLENWTSATQSAF